ncbi:cytochrome C oxidase assembly protein [Phaeobacter sp. HF9A]|uniref:cytochrome C oxidase assembly protein n=1 Tax=Phaeobacter sp. HF9A TaxID=2721561 RepID=UPI0014314213|nr:cytochrome C oxidase assembly protein [Phaeobacter sp. HF9A]NIZ14576.1 cytochrome C oxidase assembly protein [Phaeobacter sp. HF9A]
MSLNKQHELHARRKGRNVGVGLLLAGFVVLVMALTVVKLTSQDFTWPDSKSEEQN